MLTVHVRVTDGATGKPTPVRLRISDADGRDHPPFGRQARFRTGPGEDVGGQVLLGGKPFSFIDGACEARLPPGLLTVEIAKGPEYLPLHRQVSLASGQVSLRFTIDRWTDERPAGWFAGDTRATDLPPHAALLEGAGEGLFLVNLLAYERPPSGNAAAATPAAAPNLLAFSGAEPALRLVLGRAEHGLGSPDCLAAVNTLNTHPVLGSVALLNSHRPVFPLRFGQPGEPDHWSVSDWCDQCHRKKGLVVWPDLPRLLPEHPQGEALAALALGMIDAFEIGPDGGLEGESLRDYYRLLGCGFRPVLVGGSGKNANTVPLGAVRTYAHLGPAREPDLAAWIEAVRAGRTFVTTGPLLSLEVAGQGPGAVLSASAGQNLRIRCRVRSAAPLGRLELLAGPTVVAVAAACGERRTMELETDFCCTGSTWIAARCSPFGHTNPVFLEVAGAPLRVGGETLAPLLAVIDQTLAWVERDAVCETDRQRLHLCEVLSSGKQALQSRRG
jgi:hypothetical protein